MSAQPDDRFGEDLFVLNTFDTIVLKTSLQSFANNTWLQLPTFLCTVVAINMCFTCMTIDNRCHLNLHF